MTGRLDLLVTVRRIRLLTLFCGTLYVVKERHIVSSIKYPVVNLGVAYGDWCRGAHFDTYKLRSSFLRNCTARYVIVGDNGEVRDGVQHETPLSWSCGGLKRVFDYAHYCHACIRKRP
jgi:hypothetical protein